jgi:RsiW-degrading membrane proteinase PrsW (M82 family)
VYYFYWILSLTISASGAFLWVKILIRTDPGWRAKEHKWVLYILAGVGSLYLARIFYRAGYLIYGDFYSLYEAADDFWFYILVNGPAEEWGKFLVFWLIARVFGRVNEPRDGVLWR